jgi:hypothetical protein
MDVLFVLFIFLVFFLFRKCASHLEPWTYVHMQRTQTCHKCIHAHTVLRELLRLLFPCFWNMGTTTLVRRVCCSTEGTSTSENWIWTYLTLELQACSSLVRYSPRAGEGRRKKTQANSLHAVDVKLPRNNFKCNHCAVVQSNMDKKWFWQCLKNYHAPCTVG